MGVQGTMSEHGISTTEEFVSHCDKSNLWLLSSFFKPIVMLPEPLTMPHQIKSDDVNYSPEMFVSSFRYSPPGTSLTRLLDHRIQSYKGYKFLCISESLNIQNLRKEVCSEGFTHTWDGCEDFHLFREHPFGISYKFHVQEGYFLRSIYEVVDLRFEYVFQCRGVNPYGVFCHIGEDFKGYPGWFSSFVFENAVEDMVEDIAISPSDCIGRGKDSEELKHAEGEYLGSCKFREEEREDSLDFILEVSDSLGEFLSFPCDYFEFKEYFVFSAWGGLGIGEEISDSGGILFVSLRGSEIEFGELLNEAWIDYDGLETVVFEEVEYRDMVDTGGFNTYDGRVHINGFQKEAEKGEEPLFVLWECFLDSFPIGIFYANTKILLRDIDAYYMFVFLHVNSPFLEAGGASQPILHGYTGSKTQSTYWSLGKQRTHSKTGSKTQVMCSFSCFQFVGSEVQDKTFLLQTPYHTSYFNNTLYNM